MEAEQLFAMEPTAAQAFLDRFDDGVTAIVYRDEARVGKFGERHLIVVDDDTFQASVPLGTAESRTALASFADVRARVDDKAGRATGVFGVSMDGRGGRRGVGLCADARRERRQTRSILRRTLDAVSVEQPDTPTSRGPHHYSSHRGRRAGEHARVSVEHRRRGRLRQT